MIEFATKPHWGWLLLGAVGLVALLWLSGRFGMSRISPRKRWWVTGLRVLAIVTVVLCLLDPQRIRSTRLHQRGRVAVLLDTSRSMSTIEQGQTRLERAKNWVRRAIQIQPELALDLLHFDTKAEALASLDEATPTGERTEMAAALESLRSAIHSESLARVVLISDGAANGGGGLEQVAKEFARDRVPVDTLCLGGTNEMPDLRIERVETRTAYSNPDKIRVVAVISSPGFQGRQTGLRVTQERKVLAHRRVVLSGATERFEVEFPVEREGFQTCELEIEPDLREQRTDNNRLEFAVTVTHRPLRVIYMEASDVGENFPEIFNLKWALQDEGFEVRALYHEQFRPTPLSMRDKPRYVDPRSGEQVFRVEHSQLGYPKTLEELLQFDVVICSDIAKEVFTPEQLGNTVRFVEEFGGGFVMVGGVTSFGAGQWNRTVLEKIIPVEMELERDTAGGLFTPRISPGSASHPLLQLADNPKDNQRIWTERFPPLSGFNRVDRAKPGAVTLLEHPRLSSAYGPCVILAAQEIGRGRAMAYTSDTTGIWGFEFENYWGEPDPNRKPMNGIPPDFPRRSVARDNRYYRRFWANAVRWLAANRVAAAQDSISLSLSNETPLPNQTVAAAVKVLDARGRIVRDAGVTVEVLRGSAVLQSVPALWDSSAESYQSELRVPSTGRFIIQASVANSTGQTREARRLLICAEPMQEAVGTPAEPGLLANISRLSGGRPLPATPQPGMLNDALPGGPSAGMQYRAEPLWDTWTWLALLVGLLTAEWVVRRRGGLA